LEKFTRMMRSNNKEADHSEKVLNGAIGCPGIVIGQTCIYKRRKPTVSSTRVADDGIPHQVDKFHQARKKAKKELQHLLGAGPDEDSVDLINTQIEMLKDPELCERVEQQISEHNQSADSAIHNVFGDYLEAIKQNHREDFLERSVDIADVRDRLIQIIHNHDDEIAAGSIMVAKELSPREVIAFSNQDIKGIVMDRGGTTSHAAIIARSMNIPTIVGVKKATRIIKAEDEVIIDGLNGDVIVHPTEKNKEKYRELIEQQVQISGDDEAVCSQPNRTADDHPFVLRANIEFPEELTSVEKYKAEGIGLLRTESSYLRESQFREEEHQEKFYSTILKATDPHPVIIRLFDAGGDKLFKESSKEQNPFLGWRGIRMLLDSPDLLDNQLRAILAAAGKHKQRVRILIPMISTPKQLHRIKERIETLQHELEEKGRETDPDVQVGIMVEVPNVALQARLFAREADFLSIGTNDLTQYVLAVDRGHEQISSLYEQRHPAIWQLINMVAQAGIEENTPVSVCGELASDPISACCLLGLGINELSMNPLILPKVKKMLCNRKLTDMQAFAKDLLEADTVDDINTLFLNWKESTNNT